MTNYIPADKLIAKIERLSSTEYGGNTLGDDASLQQEQPKVQNGKFIFPKYLYARTKDNKTIDMSYAPQDMTAVEYIRNDFVQHEQPDVDLDKEANECWDYVFSAIGWDENSLMTMNHKEFLAFARHFYELGRAAK